MKPRRFVGVPLAILLGTLVLTAPAAPAATGDAGSARSVTVDPALVRDLADSPGGVEAVVTAWSPAQLDEIERLGIEGTRLRVLPMMLAPNLTREQLDALKASSAVRSVWANEKHDLLMEDTTWITKARYVWPTSNGPGGPQGFGVTGAGVELAIIDTGFDGKHEDGDNLVEFCNSLGAVGTDRHEVACTPHVPTLNDLPAGPCGTLYPGPSNTGPGTTPTLAPPGCTNKARFDSTDADVAHGSHVGGTMAGTGHASGGTAFPHSTIGMAPHAKLRVYKANVGPALATYEILSSYDDLTHKKLIGYNRVVAVNNSWGGGDGANYDPADPINVAIKAAFDAGILSVFAAGNSGPEHDTLSSECVNPYVACVAASTKPDSIVMFSSRGRPSQVADTDRDGTAGDSGDIPPDNHDWRLGQALELGRYRPTLAAPGVNINSIKAFAADIGDPGSTLCQEDLTLSPEQAQSCYVQLNGTSMATPHVTGAIGLIAQAFRQGNGRMPRPNELIDILERSANRSKLPAWESEEQGAGRLDAYEAVKYARTYPNGLPRPNMGYATPPYVNSAYPGGPGSIAGEFEGCTGLGSWTARDVGDIQGVPQPPVATARYGQHFIDVPPKVDRLRITVTWPLHPTANLYARAWRPGVNPDLDSQTPDYKTPTGTVLRTPEYHQTRVFPDQEAIGLPIGLPPDQRVVDVRAPEETAASPAPPTIPSGKWILRVYHRAGGVHIPVVDCLGTEENPKQPDGYRYEVKVELGKVTHRPTVDITSPAAGSTHSERFVEIKGKAGYPPPDAPPVGNVGHPWEGVTNWEVPGSSGSDDGGGPVEPDPDTRTVLYLHGNKHVTSEPGEANPACTGQGNTDVALVGCGPFLLPDPLSPVSPAARWGPVSPLVNGVADRNIYDPNWTWCLATGPGCPGVVPARPGLTTVEGPMTVEWWASTNPACETPGLFTMGWTIRLWADGRLRFESGRIQATPELCSVPDRLKAVVNLPRITAEQRLVLHIDANELDVDQEATFVYYDSQNQCLGASAPPSCDSLVKMPVVTDGGGGGGGPTGVPDNVRVTDLPVNAPTPDYPAAPQSPRLRVAWDPVEGASYRVHRSTNPAFVPSSSNRVYSGPGQACPQGESPNTPTDNNPPGEERDGVCFTDTGVSLLTTYYYRIVAVKNGTVSNSSDVAYGTPTRYDRQVKLKVDRLYGPQYWEYALLPLSPTPSDTTNAGLNWTFLWDTFELTGLGHLVSARSFTQGIGSTKDSLPLSLDDEEEPPPPPDGGCPDDDDGDGDDDADDGDTDDDGDDDDDDCEDDDDNEEEDDD